MAEKENDKLKKVEEESKKKKKLKAADRPADMYELDIVKIICLQNPLLLQSIRERMGEFYEVNGKEPPKIDYVDKNRRMYNAGDE